MQAEIVVLPGDGIGPEVTRAAVRVLRAVEIDPGEIVLARIFSCPYSVAMHLVSWIRAALVVE